MRATPSLHPQPLRVIAQLTDETDLERPLDEAIPCVSATYLAVLPQYPDGDGDNGAVHHVPQRKDELGQDGLSEALRTTEAADRQTQFAVYMDMKFLTPLRRYNAGTLPRTRDGSSYCEGGGERSATACLFRAQGFTKSIHGASSSYEVHRPAPPTLLTRFH